MIDWMMDMIAEGIMMHYLAYYLIVFSPFLLAILFTLFHVKVTINLISKFQIESAIQVIHQCLTSWRPPILRWRIRCLAKLSDEEDVLPIY
ncbi:hypothetical protein [Macrococcus brunensis]|uniref:hypothetical protein n=1 Tax=Macrococcus brunensis TaxID=198483 RepID=UPI001EF16012|nr:hypothetical protein [Macrococcus brunensis]ULG74462.1 hypothetical protein MGG13_01420 [Macrococcus brunensis]